MSDPTDPGGVGAHAERGRPSTRVGDSGSPVGSPLTIVLALIAVIAGFLIFRSIDNSGGASGAGGPEITALSPDASSTTVAGATPSTTAAGGVATTTPPTRTGATVLVANASTQTGVAGDMTDQLTAAGYSTASATDSNPDLDLDTSVIYFLPGVATQPVAQALAAELGGLTVSQMPATVPVASMGTATVLLMLGDDIAGKTLAEIAAAAAPNVQAPNPAAATSSSAA